jgi:hypothetical protein
MDNPYKVTRIDFKHPKDLDPSHIKLIKAAVRVNEDVYCGWRHFHIMWYIKALGIPGPISMDQQGFVDQHGNFFRRACCATLALMSGQLKTIQSDRELLSEDLWDNEGNPHV